MAPHPISTAMRSDPLLHVPGRESHAATLPDKNKAVTISNQTTGTSLKQCLLMADQVV